MDEYSSNSGYRYDAKRRNKPYYKKTEGPPKREQYQKRQKNYKELNKEELYKFFGTHLDRESIDMIYEQNDCDMQKAISQLCTLTGVDPSTLTSSAKPNNESSSSSSSFSSSSSSSSSSSEQGELDFSEIKGDLFKCPATHSLAHCVSRDLRLGKGIAAIFKKVYGGIDELKSQNKGIGDVAVLKRGSRFIYNLITKENYWNKPTYEDLRASLEKMKEHCKKNGVKQLSMPRIGCGLDGLLWNDVKKIIFDVFSGSGISISIYSLD